MSSYPNALFSPHLGLALSGMHSQEAIEDFLILDSAFGAGSSINVNGTLVIAPNLSSTTPAAPSGNELVTFQVDSNGNISGYVPTASGGGTWASLTGDLTETQVIPWDGGTVGTPDTGLSRIGAGIIAVGDGTTGDFSGTVKATIINAVTGFQVAGAAASGNYLRGNGTDFVSSAIQAADLPNITSSTFSGFWGGLGLGNIFGVGTPTSSTGFTANDAYVWLFYVSEPITITKVTINVTVVAASTAASVGIYSTGGTKLVDSGLFTTTTGGTGVAVATNFINGGSSGSPVSVTLTPGWYYYMFTTNSASNGFEYFGAVTATNIAAILNKNGGRVGTATATTGGAQNTSLGTVTATFIATNADIPAAWFE